MTREKRTSTSCAGHPLRLRCACVQCLQGVRFFFFWTYECIIWFFTRRTVSELIIIIIKNICISRIYYNVLSIIFVSVGGRQELHYNVFIRIYVQRYAMCIERSGARRHAQPFSRLASTGHFDILLRRQPHASLRKKKKILTRVPF